MYHLKRFAEHIRIPFTLNSYENGLRVAYTRTGLKVNVEKYDFKVDLPLCFITPVTGKETHIRANGQMYIDRKTEFDIFEN